MATAAFPYLRALNASIRSKASLLRNTLVRPSCIPASAHRDAKSKARNSCDDCGGAESEWGAVSNASFSLKEFFRSGSDKNAVLDARKLDLLFIVLGRIVCSCGCFHELNIKQFRK